VALLLSFCKRATNYNRDNTLKLRHSLAAVAQGSFGTSLPLNFLQTISKQLVYENVYHRSMHLWAVQNAQKSTHYSIFFIWTNLITHEINVELTFEMTIELTFENLYQFRSALPHSTCHLTFEHFYTLKQLLPAVFYQKLLSFYRKLRRKLTFKNGYLLKNAGPILPAIVVDSVCPVRGGGGGCDWE